MRTIIRDNYEPVMGMYHETIVIDEARNKKWMFDCDGVFTDFTNTDVTSEKGNSPYIAISQKAFTDETNKLAQDISDEANTRANADKAIWEEIEEIEMSSDVVDVVGTYAELQAYDTSHLKDNDLIKVISDETHNDATSYYRYAKSTGTFSYVGSEGPYYTESEVDTLLGGKQDTLTAGANITITNNTISATDTTYTHFTGATASTDGVAGLVPAPIAGDEDKVLKGDGTWGTVSAAANTIFYSNSLETGSTRHIYKKADMTDPASMQDIMDANELGQVILRMSLAAEPTTYNDAYLQNIYVASGDYQALFLDNKNYYGYDSTVTSATTFDYGKRELQDKLIAGTNITISGNTISATVPQVQSATYVYYDMSDIENSSYVYFYSDAQLSDDMTVDDIYAAYQDGPVILVGMNVSDPVAYGNLVDIGEHSGDYALTFYVWQYDFNDGMLKSYRIDGLSSMNEHRAEFTKTDMAGGDNGLKIFYYDYDAALAASDGDAVPLYTGYEPRLGLDVNTEIDDDGDLFNALDGVTSALLIGIYENNSYDYYIKCADIVISSAGSENQQLNIVDPYLSIIKDELQTKQIWKFAINQGTDDVSIYKSNLQPGTMVGATSLVAGTAGLVPAPTTSDPDKYLKGDGTWAALPGANNISSNDWTALWQ